LGSEYPQARFRTHGEESKVTSRINQIPAQISVLSGMRTQLVLSEPDPSFDQR